MYITMGFLFLLSDQMQSNDMEMLKSSQFQNYNESRFRNVVDGAAQRPFTVFMFFRDAYGYLREYLYIARIEKEVKRRR